MRSSTRRTPRSWVAAESMVQSTQPPVRASSKRVATYALRSFPMAYRPARPWQRMPEHSMLDSSSIRSGPSTGSILTAAPSCLPPATRTAFTKLGAWVRHPSRFRLSRAGCTAGILRKLHRLRCARCGTSAILTMESIWSASCCSTTTHSMRSRLLQSLPIAISSQGASIFEGNPDSTEPLALVLDLANTHGSYLGR